MKWFATLTAVDEDLSDFDHAIEVDGGDWMDALAAAMFFANPDWRVIEIQAAHPAG